MLAHIDTGGLVPDIAPEARQVGAAAEGFSQTVSQGLTLMVQERVKSQTIDAHLALQGKADALDSELRTTKAYSPDALKARLGPDAYGQLPPEVTAPQYVPALDETGKPIVGSDGQPVMKQREIPTYLVAGALFRKEMQDTLDQSAQNITGAGWQANFKRAAQGDLLARWGRLQDVMLQAWHQDQVDTRSRQILTAANSARTPEEWSTVNAMVEGSREIFGDDGQQKIRAHVAGLQEVRPVYDALLVQLEALLEEMRQTKLNTGKVTVPYGSVEVV